MKWLACVVAGSIGTAGCPSADVDQNEVGPEVEFDPANNIVPFPNNLLIDPGTGKINLPMQCAETATATALRTGVLNKLDGFGTYEVPITIQFTEPVDPASLDDHAFLLKRASGTQAEDPASAQAIPLVAIVGTTVQFSKDCSSNKQVDQVAFVPKIPLDERSTYVFALVDGVKTMSGAALSASGTWGLVRQPMPPVTFDQAGNVTSNLTPIDPSATGGVEQLQGLALLWGAHHAAMDFLAGAGHANGTILVATDFTTQTVQTPLQPTIQGTPASNPIAAPLLGNQSILQPPTYSRAAPPFNLCPAADSDPTCFIKTQLSGGHPDLVPASVCQLFECDQIGDILGSVTVSKQYLSDTPNAYTDPNIGNVPIPGPWTDPVDPTVVHAPDMTKPPVIDQAQLETLIFIPKTAAPAGGFPTVLFQHGLGRSKNDTTVFAGHLNRLGFAVVAIDAVAHGSRAVRISNDATKLCGDVATSSRPDKGPDPTANLQCYAPFLSSNLGATRDGIRQTVLDHQQVITSMKACGTTNCGQLKVDASKLFYIGQSLGGIMGSVTTATRTDLKASVLNVPGVGWVDILENTPNLTIKCSLVDSLIDAGIVMGDKFDGTNGLCVNNADWQSQPGYQQFAAIGRWVLDPADPANFTNFLAQKTFLIQEVVDDQVVPNIATNNEGALVGKTPGMADPNVSQTPAPSAAILADPTSSKWVQYPTLPPDAASGFPGNTYVHGSLLSPANQNNDGVLGTIRMDTDALAFISIFAN